MKCKQIYALILTSLYILVNIGYSRTFPILPKRTIPKVEVKEGQTLYQIAKSSQLTLRQLHKFNDFNPQMDLLEPGTFIYLAQKKRKSAKHDYILVEDSATLRQIANKEGIRLKSLMRMNQGSSPDEQLPNGVKVFLR